MAGCLRGRQLKAETEERKETFSSTFARPHFVCHWYPLGCCDYVTIYPCFVLDTNLVLKWYVSFITFIWTFESPLWDLISTWLFPPMHKPIDFHMRKALFNIFFGSFDALFFFLFIYFFLFMLAPLLSTLYSRWLFVHPMGRALLLQSWKTLRRVRFTYGNLVRLRRPKQRMNEWRLWLMCETHADVSGCFFGYAWYLLFWISHGL